jgi:hypothetical protein
MPPFPGYLANFVVNIDYLYVRGEKNKVSLWCGVRRPDPLDGEKIARRVENRNRLFESQIIFGIAFIKSWPVQKFNLKIRPTFFTGN